MFCLPHELSLAGVYSDRRSCCDRKKGGCQFVTGNHLFKLICCRGCYYCGLGAFGALDAGRSVNVNPWFAFSFTVFCKSSALWSIAFSPP